ncbi:hypothetical protein JOC75_004685 [Metabacillus crassostreae]|uniref:hypothetical protein n=1 Tax=Metabacillus crassostreae TaxID=929098 RepID=UPI00195B1E82|nr:hypothetical protein [Metabacillus crassostreae]MBM7606632.1 hypothetical protein [Metabacillus crassostreae]
MKINIFRNKPPKEMVNNTNMKKLSVEELKMVHGASSSVTNEHLYESLTPVHRPNPYVS